MGRIVNLEKFRQDKKKTRREQVIKKFSHFLKISNELFSKAPSKKGVQLVAKGVKLIKDSEDDD